MKRKTTRKHYFLMLLSPPASQPSCGSKHWAHARPFTLLHRAQYLEGTDRQPDHIPHLNGLQSLPFNRN